MSQNLISIKGTPKCLIINLNTDNDFTSILNALKTHISNANGFFSGAKYRIQTIGKSLSDEQFKKLELVCTQYGLTPYQEEEQNQENNNITSQGLLHKELCIKNRLITRNLRNGEKIFFDGNLILIGDINPGAEVIATGNIIVMGSVKGIVHAGANGDQESYIVASILDPIQIRIGSLVSRKPENTDVIKLHNPEIAIIENDEIIIKPYTANTLTKIC